MKKEGRRYRYFKEEEQQEKGHRGMKGNSLFVRLMIILSGWRTYLMEKVWWKMSPKKSVDMTHEEPCRAF